MAKDAKKNKVKKEKKDRTFFKDFKAELKKVTWPTPKQLVTKTAAVIVIVIIIAAIVFALDFVFDKGYEFAINKASSSFNKNKNTNTNNETAGEGTEELVTTEDAAAGEAVQVEGVDDSGTVVTTEETPTDAEATAETEATAQ